MFIWNIDQLAAQSSSLRSSLEEAQDAWNDLSVGPQHFSLQPDIDSSHNFVKAVSSDDMAGWFLQASIITIVCKAGDCDNSTLAEAGNIEWSEVWVNTDTTPVQTCFQCKPHDVRVFAFTHELGHTLGLGHMQACTAPNPTLMCAGDLGGTIPQLGSVEAGSTQDCKQDGFVFDDDGIRCIYDWYNCTGGSDCDGVSGSSDNCPTMPNQTQRNYDGEIFELGSEALYDDHTSLTGFGSPGDVCDPDDDGDGVLTSVELSNGCTSAGGPMNPLSDDTDNDLFIDGAECLLGTNPRSSSSTPAFTPDTDRDRLSDNAETALGTNPLDPDTDGDGLADGFEALGYGSDPFDTDTDDDGCHDRRETASVNADRRVSATDLSQVSLRFAPLSYDFSNQGKRNFDVNRDGKINSIDLSIVSQMFFDCPPI
jgi:hypothetical protein